MARRGSLRRAAAAMCGRWPEERLSTLCGDGRGWGGGEKREGLEWKGGEAGSMIILQ